MTQQALCSLSSTEFMVYYNKICINLTKKVTKVDAFWPRPSFVFVLFFNKITVIVITISIITNHDVLISKILMD